MTYADGFYASNGLIPNQKTLEPTMQTKTKIQALSTRNLVLTSACVRSGHPVERRRSRQPSPIGMTTTSR